MTDRFLILLCFSILYSYQIPEFFKVKSIIIIVLSNYSNILCRVISPFLKRIYFTEHISNQPSINKCCLGILMFYHGRSDTILGSHQDVFFSMANTHTKKLFACLLYYDHQVTFGHMTGICEKPRNINYRNENSPGDSLRKPVI